MSANASIKFALTIKQSLLFTDLSLLGNSKAYFKKALKINYSLPTCLVLEDEIFWNHDNDTVYNDALLKGRGLNKGTKHFLSSLSSATQKLELTAKKIVSSQDVSSANKEKLFKSIDFYYEAYLLNMPFLFLFWNTENLLTTQLKEDFKVIFGVDSNDTLQQVLIPIRETYFAKEKESAQKLTLYVAQHKALKQLFSKYSTQEISRKLESHPQLTKQLNTHLANYGFTTTSLYLGKAMTKKQIIERIKTGLENDVVGNQKEIKKQEINAQKFRDKIAKKLDKYPEVKERLHLAQELMFWKNQRLDIMFLCDFKINPLLEKLASLMGIAFEELVYLRYEEIIKWFRTGKLPARSEIAKRLKSYTLYLQDGEITLYTDKNKYPKRPQETTKSFDKKTKATSGTIAYKGKITGKVRIVRVTKDIASIQKGEILITPMTRPDMILGMEKAAAFVTDQGGMLCHAAIVAREMKKPCIVGTQNATKIFKNGMRVEVDAEKGTVTKIN